MVDMDSPDYCDACTRPMAHHAGCCPYAATVMQGYETPDGYEDSIRIFHGFWPQGDPYQPLILRWHLKPANDDTPTQIQDIRLRIPKSAVEFEVEKDTEDENFVYIRFKNRWRFQQDK